jgi:hypothetical protein
LCHATERGRTGARPRPRGMATSATASRLWPTPSRGWSRRFTPGWVRWPGSLPSRWACPRGLRPSPAGSSPTSPPVRAVAAAAKVIRVVGIALSVEHGDLGLVDCSSVAEPPRYRPGRTARPRSRDGNLRQSAVTKWWVRRQSPCCAAFVGHNPRNSRNHATSQAGRRGRSQTPPDDRPRRRNPSSAALFERLPGVSPGVRVEPGT